MKARRGAKLLTSLAVVSLIAAACGGDDGGEAVEDTTPSEETDAPGTTGAPTEPTGGGDTTSPPDDTGGATSTPTTGGGGEGAGMTVTYSLSDVAVWNDGSPMSVADFECTWQAIVNTPGSITTAGYDQITAVEEGASATEVVVTFEPKYAGWKTLFNALLQATQFADCADVTPEFAGGAYTFGGNPYAMTDWTPEQIVYEKNPGYIGERTGGPDRVIIVPAEDGVTALKSGTVDFIYPQAYTGLDAELEDPNIEFAAEPGGQFEALYFMLDPACTPDDTRSCAFADPAYREAFYKSIDMNAFFAQIYEPFAQGTPLLTCGPIAPGDYCDDTVFADTYDPEGAVTVLEEAGWTNEGGQWTNPDGEVPEVRWMVNTGNVRRESAQEYLIPLLASAGFNVVADNCEATPCVFQTRLPAQQFDMGMYISTVAPDPAYISSTYVCSQIPSEENDFQGQNSSGWCNETADAALVEADGELDFDARAELIKEGISFMAEDHVLLPTLQFPNVGAFRTDKVAGTQENLANYWAFNDWWNWEDVDGDGQIVIGAEQFVVPDCNNPVTECANSSWFQWSAGFVQFPGMYLPTNEQTFEPSEFLTGEAVVVEL